MDDRSGRSGSDVDILLVEDNPGDARLVTEAFSDARITNTLHHAADGEEALDFIHKRGELSDAPRPDVILLDLNLPGVSGEEVLTELNGSPELKRIPVIVLTASTVEADIARSYDLNANAYLTKPVDPGEFIEVVRTFEEFWISFVCIPPSDDGSDSGRGDP